MISKGEYLNWKMHPCTNRLLELLSVGEEVAVEELMGNRGEISDFQRGAIQAFREVRGYIKDGEELYDGKETK